MVEAADLRSGQCGFESCQGDCVKSYLYGDIVKYLGGKFRTAGAISGYINSTIKPGQAYWEPFVGAAWVLRKVIAPMKYASDINPYLIAMWNAAINGWVPPENVTEGEYADIKENMDKYPPELVAFVGFATSWGGKWFGGYARDPSSDRNYASEGSRSVVRGATMIRDSSLFVADFFNTVPPESNMFIYCDPPYIGTTRYDFSPIFDHVAFWEHVRELDSDGHTIVVSEYVAPEDFSCVLEVETKTDLNTVDGKGSRLEKLFSLTPPAGAVVQLTLFGRTTK